LVTGATGFIGTRLVERLFEEGRTDVAAPVRNYFTCAPVARFPVKMPRVDLLDRGRVREALRGARFVFHLAYGRDGWGSSRVTIEGTKNVVRAAIENGAESVVILSSIYVFGRPDAPGPVDESYPYRPIGAYGRGKAEMERWCLRAAKNSKTRIAVLNPSCVYGPGGTTYVRLPLHLAKEGKFCWVEGGTGAANYIYIDNLIDAMLNASAAPGAHGRRLIVTDGHCDWKEFLEPFLGAHAGRIPSCGFRELSARRDRGDSFREWAKDLPFASALRPAWKFLRGAPRASLPEIPKAAAPEPLPQPAWWLAGLFHPARTAFTAKKAAEVLDWRPRVDLKEGQKRTVRWLSENGHFETGASS
jgi:nucleoside-diphosphate-sugar epimerase